MTSTLRYLQLIEQNQDEFFIYLQNYPTFERTIIEEPRNLLSPVDNPPINVIEQFDASDELAEQIFNFNPSSDDSENNIENNNETLTFLNKYWIRTATKFRSQSLIRTLYEAKSGFVNDDSRIPDIIEEIPTNPNDDERFIKKFSILRWHIFMMAYEISHTYESLARKNIGILRKVDRDASLNDKQKKAKQEELRDKIFKYSRIYKEKATALKDFIQRVFSQNATTGFAEKIFPRSSIVELDPKLDENISFEAQRRHQINPNIDLKLLKQALINLVRKHIVENIVTEKLKTTVDFSQLDTSDKCNVWNAYIQKIGVKQERTLFSRKSDLQNEFLWLSNDPNRKGWLQKYFSSPMMKLSIVQIIDEKFLLKNPFYRNFYHNNEVFLYTLPADNEQDTNIKILTDFCKWCVDFKKEVYDSLRNTDLHSTLVTENPVAEWNIKNYEYVNDNSFKMLIPGLNGHYVINKTTIRDIVVKVLFHPVSIKNEPNDVNKPSHPPGSKFIINLLTELQLHSKKKLKDESMVYMRISTLIESFVNWLVSSFIKTPADLTLANPEDYINIPLNIDNIYAFPDDSHKDLLAKLALDLEKNYTLITDNNSLSSINQTISNGGLPLTDEKQNVIINNFINNQLLVLQANETTNFDKYVSKIQKQSAINLLSLGLQWCKLFDILIRENLVNSIETVLNYMWDGNKTFSLSDQDRKKWFPKEFENETKDAFKWLDNWTDTELSWQNEIYDSIFSDHLHDKRSFQNYKDLISSRIFVQPMHISNISDPTLFEFNRLDQKMSLIYNYSDRLAKIINPGKDLQSKSISGGVWDSNVWLRNPVTNSDEDYSNFFDFTETYSIMLTDRSNIKNRLHFFDLKTPIQLSQNSDNTDLTFDKKNFFFQNTFSKQWSGDSNLNIIYTSKFFLNLQVAIMNARDNCLNHYGTLDHNAHPFEDYFYEYSVDSTLLNLSCRVLNNQHPLYNSLALDLNNKRILAIWRFIKLNLQPFIRSPENEIIKVPILNEHNVISTIDWRNFIPLNDTLNEFLKGFKYTDGLWYVKKGNQKYSLSKEDSNFVYSCEKHSIHHRKTYTSVDEFYSDRFAFVSYHINRFPGDTIPTENYGISRDKNTEPLRTFLQTEYNKCSTEHDFRKSESNKDSSYIEFFDPFPKCGEIWFLKIHKAYDGPSNAWFKTTKKAKKNKESTKEIKDLNEFELIATQIVEFDSFYQPSSKPNQLPCEDSGNIRSFGDIKKTNSFFEGKVPYLDVIFCFLKALAESFLLQQKNNSVDQTLCVIRLNKVLRLGSIPENLLVYILKKYFDFGLCLPEKLVSDYKKEGQSSNFYISPTDVIERPDFRNEPNEPRLTSNDYEYDYLISEHTIFSTTMNSENDIIYTTPLKKYEADLTEPILIRPMPLLEEFIRIIEYLMYHFLEEQNFITQIKNLKQQLDVRDSKLKKKDDEKAKVNPPTIYEFLVKDEEIMVSAVHTIKPKNLTKTQLASIFKKNSSLIPKSWTSDFAIDTRIPFSNGNLSWYVDLRDDIDLWIYYLNNNINIRIMFHENMLANKFRDPYIRTEREILNYDLLKSRKGFLRDIIPNAEPTVDIAPEIKYVADKRETDVTKRRLKTKQKIFWDGEINIGSSKISLPLWRNFNLYEKFSIAKRADQLVDTLFSDKNKNDFETYLNLYEDELIKLYRKYNTSRTTIKNKSYISLYLLSQAFKVMITVALNGENYYNRLMDADSDRFIQTFPTMTRISSCYRNPIKVANDGTILGIPFYGTNNLYSPGLFNLMLWKNENDKRMEVFLKNAGRLTEKSIQKFSLSENYIITVLFQKFIAKLNIADVQQQNYQIKLVKKYIPGSTGEQDDFSNYMEYKAFLYISKQFIDTVALDNQNFNNFASALKSEFYYLDQSDMDKVDDVHTILLLWIYYTIRSLPHAFSTIFRKNVENLDITIEAESNSLNIFSQKVDNEFKERERIKFKRKEKRNKRINPISEESSSLKKVESKFVSLITQIPSDLLLIQIQTLVLNEDSKWGPLQENQAEDISSQIQVKNENIDWNGKTLLSIKQYNGFQDLQVLKLGLTILSIGMFSEISSLVYKFLKNPFAIDKVLPPQMQNQTEEAKLFTPNYSQSLSELYSYLIGNNYFGEQNVQTYFTPSEYNDLQIDQDLGINNDVSKFRGQYHGIDDSYFPNHIWHVYKSDPPEYYSMLKTFKEFQAYRFPKLDDFEIFSLLNNGQQPTVNLNNYFGDSNMSFLSAEDRFDLGYIKLH